MLLDTDMSMITDGELYKLMTWLSPNFPVGAFAYSHGLEYAVETGTVSDAETLTQWVAGILTFGAGRVDAALFRAAHEAETRQDDDHLARIAELGEAQRATREMALESAQQGRAFLDTLLKVWPEPRLEAWQASLALTGREPAYAVAVAVASAAAGIALAPTLNAYLHGFAANLVSAGVRLVPLGQTDGQRAMAKLEATVLAAVDNVLRRDPDDFGSAAVTVDWMSMQHETQYTRLFRS
jgi:urease accessory protein